MFQPIDAHSSSIRLMISQMKLEQRRQEERMATYYNFDFSACAPLSPKSSPTEGTRFEWEPTSTAPKTPIQVTRSEVTEEFFHIKEDVVQPHVISNRKNQAGRREELKQMKVQSGACFN